MRRFILALNLLAVVAGPARAGRRPFLVAHDAAMVPEGDVELEDWLDYLVQPATQPDLVRWWVGPRWAPVERVEVGLLTVVQQVGGNSTGLWAELIEGRARLVQLGPAGDLFGQLDVRFSLTDTLPHQVAPQLGWALKLGRLDASAQVGYAGGFGGPASNDTYQWLVWRGGVAVDVVRGELSPPLILGVEGFGEQVFEGKNDQDGRNRSTANVGPTASVAHGRLWLTAGTLFGLNDQSPTMFVRMILGLAL
jgi:hypothetical protein